MNKYHVSFKDGPTRFLLVFHAILMQNLKNCFCAIFLLFFARVLSVYAVFFAFPKCLNLHLGFSLGTVGQHFGPWIQIGQTRVMIDIKASDAHSRV